MSLLVHINKLIEVLPRAFSQATASNLGQELLSYCVVTDFSAPIIVKTRMQALDDKITWLKTSPACLQNPSVFNALNELSVAISNLKKRIPQEGCCRGCVKAWALQAVHEMASEGVTLETIIQLNETDLDMLSMKNRVTDYAKRAYLLYQQDMQSRPRTLDANKLMVQLQSLQTDQIYLFILRHATGGHVMGIRYIDSENIRFYDHTEGEVIFSAKNLQTKILSKVEALTARNYYDFAFYPIATDKKLLNVVNLK